MGLFGDIFEGPGVGEVLKAVANPIGTAGAAIGGMLKQSGILDDIGKMMEGAVQKPKGIGGAMSGIGKLAKQMQEQADRMRWEQERADYDAKEKIHNASKSGGGAGGYGGGQGGGGYGGGSGGGYGGGSGGGSGGGYGGGSGGGYGGGKGGGGGAGYGGGGAGGYGGGKGGGGGAGYGGGGAGGYGGGKGGGGGAGYGGGGAGGYGGGKGGGAYGGSGGGYGGAVGALASAAQKAIFINTLQQLIQEIASKPNFNMNQAINDVWMRISLLRGQQSMKDMTEAFHMMESIMKMKHDTQKSAISNMR